MSFLNPSADRMPINPKRIAAAPDPQPRETVERPSKPGSPWRRDMAKVLPPALRRKETA